MSFVLGLTGSIGMGKSTTAQMFRDEGIPVWDADAVVRGLYAPGGSAAKAVAALFPTAMTPDGAVSRAALRDLIRDDPLVLDRLNAVVHPLVAQARQDFIAAQTDDLIVLDVPLLFETGASSLCDGILVVTAPPEVQRQRVLDRGEMTEADLETILSRQMPDAEKRARADHVIETLTLDGTRAAVRDLISRIRKGLADA